MLSTNCWVGWKQLNDTRLLGGQSVFCGSLVALMGKLTQY